MVPQRSEVGVAGPVGEFAQSLDRRQGLPPGPARHGLSTPEALFGVRIGLAIAVFLLLAVFDHFATATFVRRTYEVDLGRGMNWFRWVEYSLSAIMMVLLIASYSGITDIAAVAGANIAMILFGWLQPRDRDRRAGLLLQLRAQRVAAIPRDRPLARPRLRRRDLSRPQPRREIRARLADLRRVTRYLMLLCGPVGRDPGSGGAMPCARCAC